MLRLTHLSRRRDACPWDLDDCGWFLRFTGDGDEWNDMREELKLSGRHNARWIPGYEWDDGREGAWWVESEFYEMECEERFCNPNLAQTAIELLDDEELQVTWKCTRYGWSTSHYRPHRQKQEAYQDIPKQEAVKPVPIWLKQEYALLELSGIASLQDCKNAYRRLSKIHHPDAGGTHLGFIALQNAYESVKRWLENCERIAG